MADKIITSPEEATGIIPVKYPKACVDCGWFAYGPGLSTKQCWLAEGRARVVKEFEGGFSYDQTGPKPDWCPIVEIKPQDQEENE